VKGGYQWGNIADHLNYAKVNELKNEFKEYLNKAIVTSKIKVSL
jgi:hypothetical protein